MMSINEHKEHTDADAGADSITLYTARWLMPDRTRTLEHHALAVQGRQIIALDTRSNLTRRYPRAVIRDYGAAAILPGFVNAHSHLELTALRNYLEPQEHDFFRWLRKLTVTKYEVLTHEDMRDAATWGAVEAVRAGITCTGDAADFGAASLHALKQVGLRGIVYQELFGIDSRQADEQLAKLKNKVARLRADETSLVRIGVSPHAPYTVSSALLETVADYAAIENLPLMIHAAESEAEVMLLREGSGAFADNLVARGISWRAPKRSPIEHLAACGLFRVRPLLAHCIRVDEQDIELIAAADARVAHCPKSNLKLGHGRAPFNRMFRQGIGIGLGSDSVASNNTCDMLEEARFALLLARLDTADQRPASETSPAAAARLTAADLLYTATAGGARALCIDHKTGVLDENFAADFAVVRLDGAHQIPVNDKRAALIFASSVRDVCATVIAGQEVYRDGQVMTVDEERLRARMIEIERKLTIQRL